MNKEGNGSSVGTDPSRRTKRSPAPHANDERAHRRLGVASVNVYEALRGQILAGHLASGTRMSHRAIAEVMKTSNGPVISALRRLAHDGLITYVRGTGGTVTEFNDEKLQDMMIVRRALETEAARLAARRASPEDLERLSAIVDRMSEIVRFRRWDEADKIDVELHTAIARFTRSAGLTQALDRCHMLDRVRRRLRASEGRQDFEKLDINHRVLVDAIASGNPDSAAQAMHTHLSRSKSSRGKIKRSGKAPGKTG